MNRIWGGMAFFLLLGIGLRVAYVNHPLDHQLVSSWHEADYTEIARNFYRRTLNIFYPQIDWRGNTPGYVEMEFPILPWLGAVLDRLFGYREMWLRVVAAVFGVGSLVVFAQHARNMLPPVGALVATAAFSLSPQLVVLSSAMQPEMPMVFFSVIAVDLIWRWYDDPRFVLLLGAAAATSAAILAKLPAAYLGMILAYVILRKQGLRAFADVRVYAAFVVAVLPVLGWYAWCYRFWEVYGNSLGLSNESHFVGLYMLWPPKFLLGNLEVETLTVFTPVGWLLGFAALKSRRIRQEPQWVWYGALWVFYLLAAGTSGDGWAWYYHSASVAPACLLMGLGAAVLIQGDVSLNLWPLPGAQILGKLLVISTLAMLIVATAIKIYHIHYETDTFLEREHRCALELAPHIPPDGLIVTSGGEMFDDYGRPVAHNRPMLFAWMDRKGFSYGDEDLSVETLEQIAAQGGRYWVTTLGELRKGRLEAWAHAHCRLVAQCASGARVYDLQMPP